MFDDIRRVGEKIDGLLGSNIFPFDYPFSYTENFLQQLDKWEAAIPLRFLWIVHIDYIPSMITTQYMHHYEPFANIQHSGSVVGPGTYHPGWDINRGKAEITRDDFMRTGGGAHGCMLCQGVTLPGETFEIGDIAIENNMGFLPGKVGQNRGGMVPLVLQWRETNRSFTDLVIRPWVILASHMGLVARPPNDSRNIKCNIHVVQLAKTYQYVPLVERKIFHFYNCVPTSVDSKELTHEDGANLQLFTTNWHYTHYSIESLPNTDMGQYMKKQGFKKFVKDMADRLLSRSSAYRKLKKKLAKVERFVDKANKIKNKIMGILGPGRSSDPLITVDRPSTSSIGRKATELGGKVKK